MPCDKAIWRAMCQGAAGKLVLWLSPSVQAIKTTLSAFNHFTFEDQSARDVIHHVYTAHGYQRVTFREGGGKVVFLSWQGSAGRGFSPDVVVVDGSPVPKRVLEDLGPVIARADAVYQIASW
ncbi:hypothetical protein SEA_DIRKDIRK_92 [Mycobacterium phage DirkDirk]|uniref:Uncharacterized protein n=1 Tax=Mycobacterium phage DirkDirk TaxID=2664225 RepID=A0A5Q2WBS1_9CAUD|nr:hypothetical protein KNU85_gp092 [Mycobacterium phage DirkDirk]QGH75202.1 hypothetical protein SEA_DIRKDIRK_92 [Mycobacterium phage DirkDirk]